MRIVDILKFCHNIKISRLQLFLSIILGAFLIYAGVAHLTFKRLEFYAQVPHWVPLSKDLVVVLSGVVEIVIGSLLIAFKDWRSLVGIITGIFFVLIFPGNISQYVNQIDAFNLNTDRARFIRLFFQPVLVAWALWATGGYKALLNLKKSGV